MGKLSGKPVTPPLSKELHAIVLLLLVVVVVELLSLEPLTQNHQETIIRVSFESKDSLKIICQSLGIPSLSLSLSLSLSIFHLYPGPDPVKIIINVNLRYTGFGQSD